MISYLRNLTILCLITGFSLSAKTVDVTILATTDLHGNLLPYDYFSAKPAARGLAVLGSLIREKRRAAPNLLLIDCGDTIQGAPLETYYQEHFTKGDLPEALRAGDPMMLAMNSLGYDAMALGNHEFNFGLRNLAAARATAKFPWLSANTTTTGGPEHHLPWFDPYVVKTVEGVKVAIIGITTPAIPKWEKPENYRGYGFQSPVEAVQLAIAKLRAEVKPDLIVVAAHSGLDRDLRTGKVRTGDLPGENAAYQIAQIPGVDVVLFGHTHEQVEQAYVGGTLVVQPKNWGMSLAEVHVVMSDDGGGWKVQSKTSKLLAQKPGMPEDPDLARIAAPYQEATEAFLNTPVTESPVAMSAATSWVEDTPILDAIQKVQLAKSKADVSFASCFNLRAAIPKGKVTIRQIAGLYIYDNELYTVEATGRMVREALENSARFFNGCKNAECSEGPLLSRAMPGFNYDVAQGVNYEIDLSKPVGQRITNLMWNGKPLADDARLRVALNNYRAAGSGGYTMWPSAKIVWRSYDEIRDLIVRYYSSEGTLPTKADDNWRILPASAERILKQEIQKDVFRSGTQ